MKYMNLITKGLCLILVLAGLWAYQGIAQDRAAEAAERDEEIAEVEAWNAEVRAAQAAADAAAAEAAIPYADGTYEGTGSGYGGEIRVSLTVVSGTITALEITSHDGDDDVYFELAESLVDEILKKQTTDIDTVSGATFSSEGILEAANDALDQAEAAKEAQR